MADGLDALNNGSSLCLNIGLLFAPWSRKTPAKPKSLSAFEAKGA
jgi:hypothetical protein